MNLNEVLVDPETKEPLRLATDEERERVVRALRQGRARRHDGGEVSLAIEGAYVSHGGRWIYPVVEGLPSFLIEERIELDEPL